jgi:hypothetical protein
MRSFNALNLPALCGFNALHFQLACGALLQRAQFPTCLWALLQRARTNSLVVRSFAFGWLV